MYAFVVIVLNHCTTSPKFGRMIQFNFNNKMYMIWHNNHFMIFDMFKFIFQFIVPMTLHLNNHNVSNVMNDDYASLLVLSFEKPHHLYICHFRSLYEFIKSFFEFFVLFIMLSVYFYKLLG